jgi:hypothetical protein
MFLPPQTWDIWAVLGIATVLFGFIMMFMNPEQWTLMKVLYLGLMITGWWISSVLLTRITAPSLGITQR